MPQLDRIHVAGFKSIRDQEISLGPLNVLIGANGSGKSNLIAVFRLLNEMVEEKLQVHVGKSGGADQLLHFGRQATDKIGLHLTFGPNAYTCELEPTIEDRLIFTKEQAFFQGKGYSSPYDEDLGSGHKETQLLAASRTTTRKTIADHVLAAIKSWKIYHFHDTSDSARVKGTSDLDDNERLRPDAGNLASFLYRLRETDRASYRNAVDTVRMVAPFFRDFNLRPDPLADRKIRLEWQDNGSDSYFNAHALSDGTLRFICLATLLLQPEMPTTVLIDEPELGLHPYAIAVLADLLRSAAARTQLLVSTQSVTLVDHLDPEDVVVVDREAGESLFHRLGEEEIAGWLDDYSLGDLWEKNVIGGRPAR
jgi:predicted ATPase